jgi:dTDP-4-dehydrorhamnose 3,5-epimerase
LKSFDFSKLELADCWQITPQIRRDSRGSFSRIACAREFAEQGLDGNFVQSNLAVNAKRGTFRGLHFQRPPSREAKLVRCVAGAVLDILLDLRKGSTTFLQATAVRLSDQDGVSLFVPPGVAHGYITEQDGAILVYHHSDYYQPDLEAGVRYNDPKINLQIPELKNITSISERDANFALLPMDFEGL